MQGVVLPVFILSLLSCLSVLIPPARPSSRVLIVVFCLLLNLLYTPKDLLQPSHLSSILSSSTLLHMFILLETIVAASVSTSLPTYGGLSSLTMWLGELLWRHQEKKTLTQQEVRYKLARILDFTGLAIFIITDIYIFTTFFLSAPMKISY